MEEWYLITELAEELDVAETTARRWAKLFDGFLPAKRFNRITRYSPEAVQVLGEIAALYRKGFTTEEIRHQLETTRPRALVLAPEEEQGLVMSRQRAIVALERLANVLQVLADQKEELKRLEDVTEDLTGRDQEREMELQYLKHRMDSLEKEVVRRPWWRRVF
jgi:DNA-binding transcriptional MerR regulator